MNQIDPTIADSRFRHPSEGGLQYRSTLSCGSDKDELAGDCPRKQQQHSRVFVGELVQDR
jgi:hypothetical protein